ncbi:MAG: M48 family metallopeptidase [Candidatus Komeilibacteria bacterium]|nr:M48 family metallopeptidase [Candidatus Komeilibacteria bacterium]
MYSQIDSNKRKSIVLLSLFIVLISAVGYWASWYFEAGPGILVIALLVATGMALTSYYRGDRIALAVAHAKPIVKEENPYVYRLVENLCITIGVPTPKIYIIPDSALNAFATGRDPQHASIALTTGIIEALENEELEGVIAHELSHVKNYDIRLATIVIVCVGLIALIADFTTRSMFFGGRRSNSGNRNAAGILLIIGLIFAILAPIAAQLIQLAISRKREFLADASGALATRYPEGLARALEKIGASKQPLHSANRATAHLYIANPFKADGFAKVASNLFSTHPPLALRIKRLRQP